MVGNMDVELAGQEAEYAVWLRVVVSTLGMGRMVAPHAAVQARIRAGWEALAAPRTQMEMRGNSRSRGTSRKAAAAGAEPATLPLANANRIGGFEFAQLAVPERFADGIRAWCQQQWYEVRMGDSLSPAFRTLTIWRRWQHIVIEVEEEGAR